MAYITLTRVKSPAADSWLTAVGVDYDVPKNATVFTGWGLNDERVAFWIDPDGSGFGAIDRDPEGYVAFSAAISRDDLDFESNHPGVDEYEFEPGTFDPLSETLEIEAGLSFF